MKDKHGFVMAGMEDVKYREYGLELKPGDFLFLYTDGVAEATNAEEQLYGTERMVDALNSVGNVTPRELLLAVRADIDRFVGEAEQFDDITMLALQVKG
ncbi:MAG: PP2C family protein-serine/threonine phosphatase [Lachnospiraceae bacterium]|nr:PP2C family protein-serine/threonine phosphatase [Lachnospiraceae bacterium]